jgi:hypothetical protein
MRESKSIERKNSSSFSFLKKLLMLAFTKTNPILLFKKRLRTRGTKLKKKRMRAFFLKKWCESFFV